MAIVRCKECCLDISDKAEKCPHCGAPNKAKRNGCLVLILAVVIFVVFSNIYTSISAPDSPANVPVSDAECVKSLQCWGDKHNISAAIHCQDPVERLAKNTFRWTDGMLETKFLNFRWFREKDGTLTYIGDRIEFQNGFGAWQVYTYQCDYDPATAKVLGVHAQPGRIAAPIN